MGEWLVTAGYCYTVSVLLQDTWAAYCNRQRRMRVNESGVGLTGQSAILGTARSANFTV